MRVAEDHPGVAAIRDHYDRLSVLYHHFWGDHIHHGYWEGQETPAAAQEQLTARLAARAGIAAGSRVLDVGCGLGGSARWLARHLGCSVLGVTISPVQAQMATDAARKEGLASSVRFEVRDANHLDLPPESFDAVWVIECSEHLGDKARFIRNAGRALRPGGILALCAWLTADTFTDPAHEELVDEVCRGMLCPSLGSRRDYTGWMEAGGFEAITAEDLTRRVERTWKHGAALARRPEFQLILKRSDDRTRRFVESFAAIERAYAEGAMAYGLFTAKKGAG